MKKQNKYLLIFLVIILGFVSWYLITFNINCRNNEKVNYYALATYMQNFNKKAVASLLKDDNLWKLSDDALLTKILNQNPEINHQFKTYNKKLKHDTDETILILGDDKRLLLEDASRTAEFDHHYHESQEVRIFDFTMELKN